MLITLLIFSQLMKPNLLILSKVVQAFHIPGYELIRRDRNRNGGGVDFYIKTSINFVVRPDINVLNLENF